MHVVAEEATGLAGAAAAVREHVDGVDAVDAVDAVALLGLPAGTPITESGVDSVRTLAGRADVHVVSDDPDLLARLATAVGAGTRVRYRLADHAPGLGAVLRDTAVESAGLQQVLLTRVPADEGVAVSFGVVAADGTLVLVFPARTTAISVQRPGQPAAAPGSGTRVVEHADRTELVVDSAGEVPGTWTVRAAFAEPVSGEPVVGEPVVGEPVVGEPVAWVRGGVDLTVETPEVEPGRRLLRVSTAPGSSLRQVSLPRTRLSRTPDPEAGRPLVLRVRPSRAHRDRERGNPEAAARAASVPAFGHVVDLPGGPAVLDVPFDVVGADADGTAFARRARAGVVVTGTAPDLAGHLPLQVTGRITEVRYHGGTVTGVRVTAGARSRELLVRSEDLGAAIAAMDTSHPVVLGVRGADLEWVFLPFSTTTPKEQP
ncbi:hypothetical protein ACVDFE_21085 [Lentzea chajnantorensis]